MAEDYYPFVSIIFPNWNGKKDTIECLDSLKKLEYPKSKLEIIIVDNNSVDGSQAVITQKFSLMRKEGWFSLKLIKNEENYGPSVARNLGIEAIHRQFEYVWMLDNDIVVDKKALNVLLEVAKNSKNIGIVGSVNYSFIYPDELSFSGGMINSKICKYHEINKENALDVNFLSVDYVSGSSMIIKKGLIQKIGIYDPDYFCYFNEIDLCIRAKKAGFRIILAFPSKVRHKLSSSTQKVFGFRIYYKTRNKILLKKKNFKLLNYALFLGYQIIFGFLLNVILIIYQKEMRKLPFLYKGMRDGIQNKTPTFFNS